MVLSPVHSQLMVDVFDGTLARTAKTRPVIDAMDSLINYD
jgi:phosphatidylserine synthase